MKSIEKLIETLCVAVTVVFFLAVAAMVAGQAVAVVTLNGDLAVSLSNLIAKPASTVSAVATVLAIILGYIRGQMSS